MSDLYESVVDGKTAKIVHIDNDIYILYDGICIGVEPYSVWNNVGGSVQDAYLTYYVHDYLEDKAEHEEFISVLKEFGLK